MPFGDSHSVVEAAAAAAIDLNEAHSETYEKIQLFYLTASIKSFFIPTLLLIPETPTRADKLIVLQTYTLIIQNVHIVATRPRILLPVSRVYQPLSRKLSRRSKSRLRRLSESIRKEVGGSKSNPVIGQGDTTVGKEYV